MSVWKLWVELTRMVLAGRGEYSIGAIPHNPYDPDDEHVDAVSFAANWQVARLDWVGGEDRFAVLDCLPDCEPVYDRSVR